MAPAARAALSATSRRAPWQAPATVAFVLAGFVARAGDGGSSLPAASVVALPQGFALVRLHQTDGESAIAGFDRLTEEAAAAAAAFSTVGRLAYIEAEFFGGTGTQAALGWDGGRIAFGPRLTQTPGEGREHYEDVEAGADLAINEALRWLGVSAEGTHDEFDTLGLGRLDELRSEGEAEPTAAVAVQSFIDALRKLSGVLAPELGGPLDGERLSWLLADVRQRGRDRDGVIAPGVHYAVHGVGCRFTLLDGAEVDVDLDAERSAVVFDAWRVRWFAASVGHEVTADDEPAVGVALRDAPDAAETRPGWFTVPGGPGVRA